MDLGISGKRALVCGSSKGLGRGCAEALAQAGVNLVLNGRTAKTLNATAQHIRDTYGVQVDVVLADVATADGQAALLAAAGDVDILVNNAGGPPPGMWSDWNRDDFIAALDANMLAPIALMKALLPGMIDHVWVCQVTHSAAWAIKRSARRADGLCGGYRTAGRSARRDDQQYVARNPCNGSRR
jgi:3-oxoacyl-[acyl-carrier protein] reductase